MFEGSSVFPIHMVFQSEHLIQRMLVSCSPLAGGVTKISEGLIFLVISAPASSLENVLCKDVGQMVPSARPWSGRRLLTVTAATLCPCCCYNGDLDLSPPSERLLARHWHPLVIQTD